MHYIYIYNCDLPYLPKQRLFLSLKNAKYFLLSFNILMN